MPRLRTTILLLATLQILPGADWKDKPFPDWSDSAVVRLVADSPWAKSKTVRINWTKQEERKITYKDVPGADHSKVTSSGGSPVGGIGAPKSSLPDRGELIIRWASALPIRQAKALYKQRDEKLDPSKLNGLIAQPEPDYVIEVYGIPAMVAHQGTGTIELLVSRSAYLQTRKGRTIRPNRVEVNLHALTMTVLVHFPRTEPIQEADSEIEFGADLQVLRVQEKFRLSSMRYMGGLEL